ncbi:hypothetical protein [Muriicola sp. Z0-33]|uniref:hypothetical protein n=1 Tax=Muriicola sp. Z0-33 TaxID=2816957 RepID=UPI002238B7B8|nr:hypothetical protein [Muriicola sp. Z0-33]MCW5515709.1 hypothetical protein [Muriicola sp. Z0-33]
MNKIHYLFLLIFIISCKSNTRDTANENAEIVKFWSIKALQFNDDVIVLDDCTKQDYLDIRADKIALSFHCEYNTPDSLQSYHTHKLNWEQRTDSSYTIYSDDRTMDGFLILKPSGELEMTLEKSDNRTMKAVFE